MIRLTRYKAIRYIALAAALPIAMVVVGIGAYFYVNQALDEQEEVLRSAVELSESMSEFTDGVQTRIGGAALYLKDKSGHAVGLMEYGARMAAEQERAVLGSGLVGADEMVAVNRLVSRHCRGVITLSEQIEAAAPGSAEARRLSRLLGHVEHVMFALDDVIDLEAESIQESLSDQADGAQAALHHVHLVALWVSVATGCGAALLMVVGGVSFGRSVLRLLDEQARRASEAEALAAQLQKATDELQIMSLVARYTDNAVIVTDDQIRIAWVNEGFTRITGYRLEEAIGLQAAEFRMGPETDQAVFGEIMERIGAGKAFKVEMVMYTKDQRPYWCRVDAQPVFDDDGQIVRWVGIESDVTDRKHMELVLQRERAMLADILAAIPSRIFWKDREGRYLGCNNAFAQAAGRGDPSGLIGLSDDDLPWSRQQTAQYRRDDWMVTESGQAKLNIEERVRLADGSEALWLTSKAPLRDESGAVIGVLGVATDITERKTLEDQLTQAQKLESIGQLAAGIAHEINTPTQYVSDNTRFLEEHFGNLLRIVDHYAGQLDPNGPRKDWETRSAEVRQMIEEMDIEFLREEIPKAVAESLEGLQRVTEIVRAMKAFSHAEGGDKSLADLNQAVRSTVTVCRNRWKYVAELDLDLDEDLPEVPCLLGEINQVILNLIVNAADAIEAVRGRDGPLGRITVSTRHDGNWVELRVSDTGGGIPERVRRRVFDMFFTTKSVGHGTGQGLAISRKTVVDKHGGTIRFDTEIGRGTTFIVRLPVGERARGAGPHDAAHADAGAGAADESGPDDPAAPRVNVEAVP